MRLGRKLSRGFVEAAEQPEPSPATRWWTCPSDRAGDARDAAAAEAASPRREQRAPLARPGAR